MVGRFNDNGTLNKCYSRSPVNGFNSVGGLIGYATHIVDINNNYSTGSVVGGLSVGGLIGSTRDRVTVQNCFSTGNVQGEVNLGGLVGLSGSDDNIFTNSYWDVDNSGQEDSVAGEGRSTSEMTYIFDDDVYVNWDFDDIWDEDVEFYVNNGYPILRWQYSTSPSMAINPYPVDQADSVNITNEHLYLSWDYIVDSNYRNPVGFRVYLNTTGEFDESDEFTWAFYFEEEQRHYCHQTGASLDHNTTYYWKVIPTTYYPYRDVYGTSSEQRERRRGEERLSYSAETLYRGDAEDPEIWSFTTAPDPNYPLPATNPDPPDKSEDILIDLQQLSWSYKDDGYYIHPVGFRVYINTTGDFEDEHHYEWVDYTFGQRVFSYTISQELGKNTAYYWQVIPSTIDSNMNYEALNMKQRRSKRGEDRDVSHEERSLKSRSTGERTTYHSVLMNRNDAIDCPVWSFTTGTKSLAEQPLLPAVTTLKGNYPNPFNPDTIIDFSVANSGDITLDIYDIKGRLVNTLARGYFRAGYHTLVWKGEDAGGRQMPSGIYFYRLQTENKTLTRKMMLLK